MSESNSRGDTLKMTAGLLSLASALFALSEYWGIRQFLAFQFVAGEVKMSAVILCGILAWHKRSKFYFFVSITWFCLASLNFFTAIWLIPR